MKQDDGLSVSAQDSPLAAAATASVGPALRALRQAKGLSLDEVSSRLKFSARQIEALEQERWQDLPGGISLRGLVRNYARLLGADPQALIAAIEPHVARSSQARLAGSIGDTGHPAPADTRGGPGSGFWLVLGLLVAAGLVAVAFWQGWLPTGWLSSFDWFTRPSSGG
ncbi:helix-turn-helix domain-containing protein [Orrella sp. JC864]|uniref:helix-turn-helix domain-containing protein n=1 Tax=Orrella sp. JC864 TaxID=3120298 RepID=UPI0012BD0154